MEYAPWLVYETTEGELAGFAYGCKHRERAGYRWSVDTSIYVRPQFHRRGIARALYEKLLGALTAQGYCNAFAGITLPNDASIAFHESLGFTKLGTYRNVGFKMGRWRDVAWWQRQLAELSPSPAEPSRRLPDDLRNS